MAIAKMNSILLNNWDPSYDTFNRVAKYARIDYSTADAYLFLRKELDVDTIEKYKVAYQTGNIRHCKPYRGHWIDYTAHKEFNTLEEWVKDAGDTIENVLYGVNRIHKQYQGVSETPKYVTLERLLEYYGYVKPLTIQIPVHEVLDTFDDIAKELNISDLQAHGRICLIKKPDGMIVIGNIVDQKHYSLDDASSQICISVPQDTPYEIKLYDRLSDMPAGMTVYFRMGDGYFHSIDEIMKK